MPNFKERFWAKVFICEVASCWPFTGSLSNGYGKIKIAALGGNNYAHRVAWYLTHGEMPQLDVLHRCDNPKCCNPAHLFLGTHAENMKDRQTKGRYRTGQIPATEHLPSTGHRGISKHSGGFIVKLGTKYLGIRPTLEEAIKLKEKS